MRLDSFLLADAATVADGKLYVHGGGITRLTAVVMPLNIRLVIAARFRVDEDEIGAETDRSIAVGVLDPDGASIVPPLPLPFRVPADAAAVPEGEERYLQFALEVGLSFPRAGVYRIRVELDREVVREMTLPVVALSQAELGALLAPPTPEPTAPNRAERRRQQRSAPTGRPER